MNSFLPEPLAFLSRWREEGDLTIFQDIFTGLLSFKVSYKQTCCASQSDHSPESRESVQAKTRAKTQTGYIPFRGSIVRTALQLLSFWLKFQRTTSSLLSFQVKTELIPLTSTPAFLGSPSLPLPPFYAKKDCCTIYRSNVY